MERFNQPISRRAAALGLVSLAGTAALAGCGSDTAASDGSAGSAPAASSFKVGVLQLTQHAALDAANAGFVAALADAGISEDAIDQQNASNDQSACATIAQTLVNDGCDLILAIGTPAAQAVLSATTEIPIIGTAITDFAASGLVASNEEPGGNLTGTSDMNPVSDQIDLLQQLVPDAGTVGLIYCTLESNSEIQIEMAEEALAAAGIESKRFTVSTSNEIQSAVETMVGEVDAVYTPTDNTISAAMAQVADIAVEAGGLASVSINYEELGYRAGEMAVQILVDGADPATMPVETMSADECDLVYNQATADAIGVDVSALTDEGGQDVSAA